MRFISILASASVKLATRVPGATKVVCPTSPEMAPINLDAMGDGFFQSVQGVRKIAKVVQSVTQRQNAMQ